MAAKHQIYGIHAVKNILIAMPQIVQSLVLQKNRDDSRIDALQQLATSQDIAISHLHTAEFEQLLGARVVHQGVVALCHSMPVYKEHDLLQLIAEKKQHCLLLILDGIQDPHNLGACIRSANAMGVDAVIIPKDKAVGVTETVQKVACGAAALTPVVTVTNLSRSLQKLKQAGVWLVGLAGESELSITQQSLTGSLALILGNEGTGLRRLTREHCDFLVKIPMYGSVASLNVSVSCGIALYEASKQRGS